MPSACFYFGNVKANVGCGAWTAQMAHSKSILKRCGRSSSNASGSGSQRVAWTHAAYKENSPETERGRRCCGPQRSYLAPGQGTNSITACRPAGRDVSATSEVRDRKS